MTAHESGRPIGRIGPKADRDLTNAEKIIFGLIGSGQRLATAESVTAGAFGHAVTRVPGASRVYVGGVVVYTRAAKKQLLGIPDELLDKGLVTQEITLAMAKRVIDVFGVHYAAAVTGNAGPTSDEGKAPVGDVHWALADATGREIVRSFDLFGSRDAVRAKTVTEGLRMLRNFIEGEE